MITVGYTIAVAFLTYYLVERPARRALSRAFSGATAGSGDNFPLPSQPPCRGDKWTGPFTN